QGAKQTHLLARRSLALPNCRDLFGRATLCGAGRRNFFLPSGGVFIESAHTVSAARATLTHCSSETASNFCQFYLEEKLAAEDQLETRALTLWRTFSRAGQIGCRSSWPFAAW